MHMVQAYISLLCLRKEKKKYLTCGIFENRTVAVTPMRSRGVDFVEVKRVCQSCTLAGLKVMYEAGPSRPFRFLYLSAEGTPRDLTKKPSFMGDYQLMRVSTPILCCSLHRIQVADF